MKIVTLVTTVALDKSGKPVSTPPGLVDVDDDTAKQLISRGQAKTVEVAADEAAAEADGVSVKQASAKATAKPK